MISTADVASTRVPQMVDELNKELNKDLEELLMPSIAKGSQVSAFRNPSPTAHAKAQTNGRCTRPRSYWPHLDTHAQTHRAPATIARLAFGFELTRG